MRMINQKKPLTLPNKDLEGTNSKNCNQNIYSLLISKDFEFYLVVTFFGHQTQICPLIPFFLIDFILLELCWAVLEASFHQLLR